MGFALLVTMMFMLLVCEPVWAEEYTTVTVITDYIIPWGNGIDDDGDGIVDNWGEDDVINGTVPITGKSVFNDWNTSFMYPSYDIPYGVKFGAAIEEIWAISANENTSVNPYDTCYFTNTTFHGNYFEHNSSLSGYTPVNDTICVLRYYINVSPGDLMNGAQEFYYRSPLVWNDATNDYTAHYLNIYDTNNVLVWASTNDTSSLPMPKYQWDNSSLNGVGGQRIYYRINMPFWTEERYRFEEYVTTLNDDPMNHVKVYACRGQDIASDGETHTYIFAHSPYGRKVPVEPSWSAIFTMGMGPVGTQKPVYANEAQGADPTGSSWHFMETIFTQRFSGDPTVLESDNISFTIPFRMNNPIDFNIQYRIWSGGSYRHWCSINTDLTDNITGTLNVRLMGVGYRDPDPTAPNDYQLRITVIGGLETADDVLVYYMHPEAGASIVECDGLWIEGAHEVPYANYSVNHFAMHIELFEEDDTSAAPPVLSEDWSQFLQDALADWDAFWFIILKDAFNIPYIGFFIGTYLTSTWMTGHAALQTGIWTIDSIQALTELTAEQLENLQLWWAGVQTITARAVSGFIEGITHVAGGIWKVIVQAAETIVEWATEAIGFLGIILSAVAEIIWFLAALVIIWGWSKFLEIMKWVTLGKPERALKTVAATARAPVKVINQTITKGAKTVMRAKGVKKRWFK